MDRFWEYNVCTKFGTSGIAYVGELNIIFFLFPFPVVQSNDWKKGELCRRVKNSIKIENLDKFADARNKVRG